MYFYVQPVLRTQTNRSLCVSPSKDKKVLKEPSAAPGHSVLGLVFRLLVLLLLGMAAAAATCRLTDLRREAVCTALNTAVDDGLWWAQRQEGVIRELLSNLSAAAKDFLESTRASKS